MKKLVASLLACSVMLTSFATASPAHETSEAVASLNYAKALQESLYFYECQQSNELPEWNRVEWKADCTTDDFIKGGWYDAGDHVKFNLPMAYSAAMLSWGLYMYGDAVEKIGQYETYQNNLEYTLDYLADCDLGDEAVYQVGNGKEDHTWWGPVELLEYAISEGSYYKRPYYTTTDSAVCGEMAAALAAGAAALKGKSDKTDDYIKHAESLFKMADKTRSDEAYNDSDAQGFYRSSHFYDELFWAANWLYIATEDKSYLDTAKSYIPELGKELGTNELKYSWTHCWDDVQQGGMLLYAINTQDSTYIKQVEKHVSYWTNDVKKIDGGLRWLSEWGCLRYATTAGFLASVACDTILKDSASADSYKKFYEEQINYSLGENPANRCYVVGLDESSPKNPHHRTAHGSWKNDLTVPADNRHILYGALVGGPLSDDSYEDDRSNFMNNEVATDYNAGYTALLCKMISEYGGKTDPSFPPKETRTAEYFVETKMKLSDESGATLSFKFTNHTAWPARFDDNLSFRYYIDISEMVDKGFSASDVVVRCDRNQSTMYSDSKPATISELKQYDGNIYYVEVNMPDGKIALPISEGRHQCEFLIAFIFPNYGSGWDASNDFSNQEILKSGDDSVITKNIPIYQNGKLIFGCEPDGTEATAPVVTERPKADVTEATTTKMTVTQKPSDTKVTTTEAKTTTPVTTTPTEKITTKKSEKPVTSNPMNDPDTPIMYGDLDGSGTVEVTDLTYLSLYLLGDMKITDKNILTACDVTGDGNISIADLAHLKQYIMQDDVLLGPKKKK